MIGLKEITWEEQRKLLDKSGESNLIGVVEIAGLDGEIM